MGINVPHFHHRLVKNGGKISREKRDLDHSEIPSSSLNTIADLISFLVKNAIVSEYQVGKGISQFLTCLFFVDTRDKAGSS